MSSDDRTVQAEHLVLRLTAEILGLATARPQDAFFALGGDSVSAMHLIGRLKRETGVSIRLRTIFETDTLGEFAGVVARAWDATEPENADGEDPRAALRRAFRDQASPDLEG